MTFDRPKGGFTQSKIEHYGVGAWCCYDSVEFCLRDSYDGKMEFSVFCKLDGEDRHMQNFTTVRMTREQIRELIRYLEEGITEGKQ